MRPAPALLLLFLGNPLCAPAAWCGDGRGGEHDEAPRPFPEVQNTQPGDATPNTPLEAAAAFTVPDGFNVTLFAGEPDVAQPIAMTFDDRGRLWVAECFTYTGREYDVTHGDRVTIFEDADGDGAHDTRKVFWDRGFMLTGVEYGFGGLWVLNDGTLSFIPDRDGDDVPDGEPVAMLDGFTHEAEHNVVNGLAWGPDGWLYGRHGIQATSRVGLPGASEEDRTPLNCGIWRFHPTRHAFEVVARGTTNPWGLDWNEYGDAFMTNNVIGHAWHVIPGAHYDRMFGRDFDPHLYGLIGTHADHYHWDKSGGDWIASRASAGTAADFGGGHSHSGAMIYQGDNWPEEYRGDLYMCNTHGKRVNRDAIVPHGSGYKITHKPDFAFANSEWFKGVELKSGPDGGVFLLDWTDLGECHDHDGVHRTSGRIYKIAYGTPDRAGEAVDLAKLSAEELVKTALEHPNVWHRRHAGRRLMEKADGDELSGLLIDWMKMTRPTRHGRAAGGGLLKPAKLQLIRSAQVGWAAAVVSADEIRSDAPGAGNWYDDAGNLHDLTTIALKGDGTNDEFDVIQMYQEADRLALAPGDAGFPPGDLPRSLFERSQSRLAVASYMQRLPVRGRLSFAARLASQAEDADDHNLPLMTWYGVEPAVAVFPAEAVTFAAKSKIPLLREFTARRLADELGSATHAAALDVLLAVAAEKRTAFQTDVLTGTLAALDGRRKVTPPPGWGDVQPVFLASEDEGVVSLARRLGVLFGDGAALGELRAVVVDREAPADRRIAAVESLAEAGDAAVLPDLLDILKQNRLPDRAVMPAAARALAAYESPEAAELLVSRLEDFQNQTRDAALATLVSRPSYARALAEALPGLPVTELLSPDHVRSLRAFGDEEIDRVLDEEWGTTRSTPAEKLAADRGVAGEADDRRSDP